MFIKSLLGNYPVKEAFVSDPLSLLQLIVRKFVQKVPFQNISSFGRFRPVDRYPPGLRDMLQAQFQGYGGLCGHNNAFLYYELQGLGFKVTLHQGMFVRTGIRDSHMAVIATIKGQKYLVDAGIGIPLHEPVPIDALPYIGRGAGFNYKYDMQPEKDSGTLLLSRTHEGGDPIIGPFRSPDFQSPQNYQINPKAIKFQDSREPIGCIYNNPHSVFLHQGIYAFKYLSIEEDNSDYSCITVRGKEKIIYTKETRNVEKFQTYKDLIPVLLEYFPMIPKEHITQAAENYDIPFEEALKLPSIRRKHEHGYDPLSPPS